MRKGGNKNSGQWGCVKEKCAQAIYNLARAFVIAQQEGTFIQNIRTVKTSMSFCTQMHICIKWGEKTQNKTKQKDALL